MRALFITGSDTGVGKTHFTCAVARLLLDQGRKVSVCKPVATGAERVCERWLSEDTRLLAQVTGQPFEEITPYTFAEPASPAVSSRHAGKVLTLNDLTSAVRAAAHGDILLVEGVGGLLCPLTERETVADLALALAMPLIIVVRRSLGTLNHTLLTVEAAERRGLRIAGVVVSEIAPVSGLAEKTNVEELRRRLSVPILAVVPYEPYKDVTLAVAALRDVNWLQLGEVG